MSARRFPPLAERFWAKADKNGPVHPVLGTPCWLWTGAKDRAGYGRFGVNGINCMAYRVSLELVTGESLDGREVCHRCDNPPCVNPTHLVNGTRSVNMRDASAKGRIRLQKHPELVPRGTDCNFAKLDEAAVRRIRELRSGGMSLNKIAAQFGITPTNVSYIARRATWKHVA